MKLKIALYANVYDTTVGQTIAYMNFFGLFGEVILVTSESDLGRIIKECDILGLPGGSDVLSTKYNMKPGFNSRYINTHYEYLDKNLLEPWIATNKPIIGICRGMQILNVALGGTLHTHIEGHVQDEEKYARASTMQTMYTSIPGIKRWPINSFHHQAIAKVADGLEVIGWGDLEELIPNGETADQIYTNTQYWVNKNEKSITTYVNQPMVPEMVIHRTKPYVAFQYHPEENLDALAIQLINLWILKREYTNVTYKTIGQAIEKAKADGKTVSAKELSQ